MFIDFLIERFQENKNEDAIIWKDKIYSYQWLLDRVQYWSDRNKSQNVVPGLVAVLESDFSPNTIALLLSLIENRCIIVPIMRSVSGKRHSEYIEIAQGEVLITVDENDDPEYMRLPNSANHEFYRRLIEKNHPGLVLFTSGSTGKPKAAVHDFYKLLEKFKVKRLPGRMINFLRFDHWGGLNTLFHILSNAGTVITIQDRAPNEICRIIEKYKIEVLPASPTFLNLLLLSGENKRHDLSSLKTISYGSEPMPFSTLNRLKTSFPEIRLHQTYGLIELGVMRTKSKDSDSLWVKIGGEGYETRVVDGMLQIKAESAMLGYLNAPSPFTVDGWFITGDQVEVDGQYFRILGRKSEMINIGGEKLHPVEVESVLQSMEGVEDVVVSTEPSPITGQIVVARVKVNTGETLSDFRKRMRSFCRDKLSNYKVPQKVILVDNAMYGERYKKMRSEQKKNG